MFGPKVVKIVGETVTPLLVAASTRYGWYTSRTRLFRSLGNVANFLSQGIAGFRLGTPNRVDTLVLDSSAEVCVGRVVNAKGVSFCECAEFSRPSGCGKSRS